MNSFTALTIFRAFFAPRLSLALAKRFLGIALATVRFAGLPRADWKACELYGALSIFLFALLVASSVEPYSPLS